MKKLNVMGVSLDNKSIRDSLLLLDKYINDPALNLAQLVDAPYLQTILSEEDTAEYLSLCDLTIVQDETLLKEAGVESLQRLSDAKNGKFFEDFLKRITRGRRSVYILGQTASEIEELRAFLAENYEALKVCGSFALEEADAEGEKVVNDINDVIPDVIISILPSPEQERFYLNHRDKFFAHLFLGTGKFVPYHPKRGGIFGLIRKVASKRAISGTNVQTNQWML